MLSRPPACEGCPGHTTNRGFVPPTGPKHGVKLAIVGQNPGRDEVAFGEPFIGPSGQRLDRWLAQAGVPREQVAIGNSIWCGTAGDRLPKKAEARECWRRHVRPWLASLGGALRVVVPVGVPAMQVIISPDCTASTAGTVHPIEQPWKEDPFAAAPEVPEVRSDDGAGPVGVPPLHPRDGRAPVDDAGGADGVRAGVGDGLHRVASHRVVAVPILHPAFIMRGQWAQEPAQVDFLRRAWDIARGRIEPDLSPLDEPPPGCNPTPTLNELRAFDLDTAPDDVLACDIEGTQGRLIGIGFCRVRDERAIYVPFLDGEAQYWNDVDAVSVDVIVRDLLRRPLVFHNGSGFDLPFLESCGYEVPNYIDDTMIRHHILYAEQPKDLESLAIRYLGMRGWKYLSQLTVEDTNK